MKTNNYILRILALSTLFLWNCKQEQTRKVENTLGNGEIETYFVLKEDTSKKDGQYSRLNAKGDTLEKAHYVLGKLEGQRILYFPNGQISIVENYINDVYNGPYQSFFENGAPKQFGVFKEGQFDGELKSYYKEPAGRLKETVVLTNGIENGSFKEYFPNGTLKSEGEYAKGLKTGAFKEYYSNGNIHAEGQYIDDYEDGEVKVYDSTGTLSKIYIYKDKKPIETITIR